MIARNTTITQLEKALEVVNAKYDNNITWNRKPEQMGKRTRFTLRVKDSHALGHRRGFSGRRMTSACWHVHGDFFDALLSLNDDAEIEAGTRRITSEHGNWQDRNIGSITNPLYFSEACDCE